MHFNAYDVFYSLNSHQYVQGDTSNFTRLQRYKRCVVSLPVCVRRCKFMVLDHLKDFLHTSHVCGRYPVWLRRCKFKWLDWLKCFSHTSHLYGRSPVWMQRCNFKVLDNVKDFLHMSHLNGISRVWAQMTLQRRRAPEKFLTYTTFMRPLPSMSE